MVGTLGYEDLTRMSDLLSLAHSEPPDPVGLPDALLLGLTDLVRCDLVSFLDLDVAHATPDIDQESDGRRVTTTRTSSDDMDPFWQHYWATAFCSYPTRTGDDRTVTMLSDFYSQREWQATPMYTEAFAGDGVQHELMCCLPTTGTRSRRVVFFRLSGPDFTERDRMVMALLRPHLAELYARARSSESLKPPGHLDATPDRTAAPRRRRPVDHPDRGDPLPVTGHRAQAHREHL